MDVFMYGIRLIFTFTCPLITHRSARAKNPSFRRSATNLPKNLVAFGKIHAECDALATFVHCTIFTMLLIFHSILRSNTRARAHQMKFRVTNCLPANIRNGDSPTSSVIYRTKLHYVPYDIRTSGECRSMSVCWAGRTKAPAKRKRSRDAITLNLQA